MRKYIALLLSICLIFGLIGCKNKTTEQTDGTKIEIALITDAGSIEDGSNNELAWLGVKKYADEHNISAQYFIPTDVSKDSYLNSIKTAVKSGAQIVVCAGYLLEEAVYDAQKQYKDVYFVLLGEEPHNSDYSDIKIGDKTECISFSEEEAGFLAGYAAVREGYSYLGFLGGMAEESVVKYGYGFVQGADYAAIEMGIKIYVAYVYANTFVEDVNVKNMAGNFYLNGCEAILACGGNMNHSVIKAAEEYNTMCMLSEPIANNMSPAVLFSMKNNVDDAVYDAVGSYYTNTFTGGQVRKLTVTEDGVGIDMDNARFSKFTDVEYDAIYSLLKSNQIKPYNGTDLTTTDELDLVNTTIVYAEL